MDRTGRLDRDLLVGVVEQPREPRVAKPAEGDAGNQPHLRRLVRHQGVELFGRRGGRESHGSRMPHRAILGGRRAGEVDEGGGDRGLVGGAPAEPAEARGRGDPHVGLIAAKASSQRRLHGGPARRVGRAVAKRPSRNHANIRHRVIAGRHERCGGRGIVAAAENLAESLGRVDPGKPWGRAVAEHVAEHAGGGTVACVCAADEFPLSFEPNAAIDVAEEGDEPQVVDHTPVASQHRADFGNEPRIGRGAVAGQESPEPSLALASPAVDPVADPQGAVRSDLDIGGQHVADRLLLVAHGERAAVRLHAEAADRTADRAAAEVGEQKPTLEMRRQAGAWVGREARRPRAGMRDRRQAPGGLALALGVPDLFAVPRPAVVEVLKRHLPAHFGTRHEMHDAGLVAGVGVVVDGEQVAEVVEGELLGVSHAPGEDLQVTAVGLAAKHRAAARIMIDAAVVLDAVAAVADGEVDAAVRTEGEAVQVVAPVGHASAIAGRKHVAFDGGAVGSVVAIQVAEPVEAGDARQVDIPAAGEDARGRAVLKPVES